jgi:hypothetical protein
LQSTIYDEWANRPWQEKAWERFVVLFGQWL